MSMYVKMQTYAVEETKFYSALCYYHTLIAHNLRWLKKLKVRTTERVVLKK